MGVCVYIYIYIYEFRSPPKGGCRRLEREHINNEIYIGLTINLTLFDIYGGVGGVRVRGGEHSLSSAPRHKPLWCVDMYGGASVSAPRRSSSGRRGV